MPTLTSPPYNAVDCGASWQQNFTYDPFGNITKSGSQSWQPSYNTANNQYQSGWNGVSYDANGNLTNDTFHSYSWDPNFQCLVGVDTTTLTCDALNRQVEQGSGSTYTEVLYSGIGKIGLLSGTIPRYAAIPLPGGSVAWIPGANNEPQSIEHKDWLGSTRLLSSLTGRSDFFDSAYAPFGENYSGSGLGSAGLNFTGQAQDTASGLYDFLYREYHPVQGRWISPDPAGIGAVDFTNPQSLNRYAYVSNMPLNNVDPQGLVRAGLGLLARCPDGPDIDEHCGSFIQWNWDAWLGGGAGGEPITYWAFDYQSFLPGDEVFVPKPLSPAAIQAIVAAISGNWRGLLDAGLQPIEQEMWNQVLNPIMDVNKDWSASETCNHFLQPAFNSATAGPFQGLFNIKNNSKGVGTYDFSYHPEYDGDTFSVNGVKMAPAQFSNYMAGFQAAAYDAKYKTGQLAEDAAEDMAVLYHPKGPYPFGLPWVYRGEQYGQWFGSWGGCPR